LKSGAPSLDPGVELPPIPGIPGIPGIPDIPDIPDNQGNRLAGFAACCEPA